MSGNFRESNTVAKFEWNSSDSNVTENRTLFELYIRDENQNKWNFLWLNSVSNSCAISEQYSGCATSVQVCPFAYLLHV